MEDFFDRHSKALLEFSWMSNDIGSRADDVQGGGGNTSVKLDGGLMAIKASGYHLGDVKPQNGYAVLDGAALRDFYERHEAADFDDVEQSGAARAKELTLQVEGLPALRPSVEAGFHSLLDTFVAHSHSVYGNLAACCDQAERVTAEALQGAPYSYALIPYVNPGAMLTFQIRDALRRVKAETGRTPAVLLMRSHGLIAHADTAEECLALHEDASRRFMAHFGVSRADFPLPQIRNAEGGFVSDTPWLKDRLRGQAHPDSALLGEPLYPDQLVFFEGTLGSKAKIDRETGLTHYDLPERSALTFEQTLCAVVFIRETLARHGLHPVSMGEAAREFISGWESEKYRKTLGQGG